MQHNKKVIGVLVTIPGLFPALQKSFPQHIFKDIPRHSSSEDDHQKCLDEINSTEILIADLKFLQPFLYDVTRVKWVQSIWAGTDNMVIKEEKPSFTLTRLGGQYGQHMSEYVLSHIIAFERRSFDLYEKQEQKEWSSTIFTVPYRLLTSLSLCILGAGEIGREIAKHGKQFGMTIFGMVSQIPESKSEYIDEYFTVESLTTYLEKSDYICNVLPKTKRTNHLLSSGILQNCANRRSVFINVGRGNIIDEDSIVQAIENEWIRGAVLDVFEDEPLPKTSKLWNLPGVIITPHCSGLTIAKEAVECFGSNLKLYEEGQELKYVVDWNKGY